MVSMMEDKHHCGEREQEFKCLFEAAMENNWKEVVKAYQKCSAAHMAVFTKFEETALHVAISCYHPDGMDGKYHLEYIIQMVDAIKKTNDASRVLSLKDVKGDTPLHLAAAQGNLSLCKCLASENQALIAARNNESETPLFLAAHHGKQETFLFLHELYNGGLLQEADQEFDYTLCRRKDGDTILHSAISGEYFGLAYQIICYYPKLVNAINVVGDSPLHILARKPSAFESSNQLRDYDNTIYQCVYVPKLRTAKYDPDADKDAYGTERNISCPRNYRTCVDLYLILRKLIFGFIGRGSRSDEENPQKHVKDPEGQHFLWLFSNNFTNFDSFSLGENLFHPANRTIQEENKDDRYPANYATCVRCFKFLMMLLLVIFGIGYQKIRKMREKKKRHKWASQIMNKMIMLERGYEYYSNGKMPTRNVPMNRDPFKLPDAQPEDDHDASSDEGASSGTHFSSEIKKENGEEKVENVPGAKQNNRVKEFLTVVQKGAKKFNMEKNFVLFTYKDKPKTGVQRNETPFLIAAKMGIIEMVEKILDKIPVAIRDLDAKDNNALLLAIKYRQTKVFHCLLQRRLPEFVLRQVDNKGNGVRHLAAKFRQNQPWRLPGAALQMHGEVTWFKHVKRSLPPLRFSRYNKKGETPRGIFRKTHEKLAKEGVEWLIKTSESCSLVAALIATVAFATAVSVPGGFDQNTGYPLLQNEPVFKVFAVLSLAALCFSLTALVFFLAIITSRCQVWDFKKNLPRKLLMGLSCLFTSVAVILASFCAGHFFVLTKSLQYSAWLIYTATSVPLAIFAFAHLPLYFDLAQAVVAQVPVPSHNVSYR